MNLNFQLFTTFARISASCFGGGYAMLPFFQRELVEKKQWLTEGEISDIFAIAQCTPGVIAINTSTFCGYRKGRLPGALFATLGVLFPPILIITVIAAFLWQFSDVIWIQHALAGIRACVCALILQAVFKLFRSAVIDLPTAGIFSVVLLLSAWLGLSPALLVIASGLFTLGLSRVKGGRKS